mgnify:CR=1 FL=1
MSGLRDMLRSLTREARKKTMSEIREEEKLMTESWRKKEMYWSICEKKIMAKNIDVSIKRC